MCTPPLLERVLEREAVEQRREHPRVVRGRAVHPLGRGRHAAVDVPGADDDRRLDAERVDSLDLRGDRLDARAVDPVLLAAEERLARELQEDALERRDALLGGGRLRSRPLRSPGDGVAHELAHLRPVLGERLADRQVRIVDPGLVGEDALREEALGEHALDDLRPDVLGLALDVGKLLEISRSRSISSAGTSSRVR